MKNSVTLCNDSLISKCYGSTLNTVKYNQETRAENKVVFIILPLYYVDFAAFPITSSTEMDNPWAGDPLTWQVEA